MSFLIHKVKKKRKQVVITYVTDS